VFGVDVGVGVNIGVSVGVGFGVGILLCSACVAAHCHGFGVCSFGSE